MRSLKSVTANSHGGADSRRDELARLGDSIDRLGAAAKSMVVRTCAPILKDLRKHDRRPRPRG